MMGLVDWEMAGFFGWKTVGEVHQRIRSPRRKNFANFTLSEEELQDIMFWNDLYEDGLPGSKEYGVDEDPDKDKLIRTFFAV